MKHLHNSSEMRARRKELRNNPTPEETKLWFYVRRKNLGFLFYRQHSIGPYVVDFYCPQKRLVIELDGEPHNHSENSIYDKERDSFLRFHNHIVLRFWNNEVKTDIKTVLKKIQDCLDAMP